MITLDPTDWITLCCVKENEICFTPEYLNLTKSLGWGARKFAAHLITHWERNFENTLDYFGPEEVEKDWYSGIDGEPMDVGELLADTLETRGIPYEGLDSEWHRDVMRAKLLTIKLPFRLITEYVNTINKNKKGRK